MVTEIEIKNQLTHDEKVTVFESTALPYMDALYRTALRLTRNEKDAEDLLQETYLRAFKSFHQFQLGTNCKAWMFKIMTNLHINRYQKQARRPTRVSFDELEDFYLYNQMVENFGSSGSQNVEDEVLKSFIDTEVKEAIEKLPYEFKMVVILADIEGFRYQEIADILECPIGTVRSRLSRGRKLLQKYLWDYARKRNYGKGSCKVSSCKEAVEKLVEYLHNELDDANESQIRKHLATCEACCSRFEFEEKLNQVIQEHACKDPCPDVLKANILKKIKMIT